MNTDLDIGGFLESYIPTKFPDFKMSGDNYMVNSIFTETEDHKHKLGINSITGVWHCFKTGRSGAFYQLYAILEHMSYTRAKIELNYKLFFKAGPTLKSPVARNLNYQLKVAEELEDLITVTPESYGSTNETVLEGWKLLMDRKLFDLTNDKLSNTFYVCEKGFYKDRLIIPYVVDGVMVYFQARALKPGMKPKYYCAKEGQSSFKGSHVLYPFDTSESYVVVCEGPFDARSLQIQGVNATCTTGMSVSDIQLDALRMFRGKLIFGYDNDKAGETGLRKADNMRRKKMMPELWYCPAPYPYKDWNEAHMKDFDLKTYIMQNSKPYNLENYVLSAISKL